MDLFSDEDLQRLKNAHTGDDLECTCWEGAKEIVRLRKTNGELLEVLQDHYRAIKNSVKQDNFEALKQYAVTRRIVP